MQRRRLFQARELRCSPAAYVEDRQPSIASYRFCSSSSKVSPWVAQPGIAGTSAQKPPSSASWITTLIFIAHLAFEANIYGPPASAQGAPAQSALTILSDIFLASPSSIM